MMYFCCRYNNTYQNQLRRLSYNKRVFYRFYFIMVRKPEIPQRIQLGILEFLFQLNTFPTKKDKQGCPNTLFTIFRPNSKHCLLYQTRKMRINTIIISLSGYRPHKRSRLQLTCLQTAPIQFQILQIKIPQPSRDGQITAPF